MGVCPLAQGRLLPIWPASALGLLWGSWASPRTRMGPHSCQRPEHCIAARERASRELPVVRAGRTRRVAHVCSRGGLADSLAS